MVLLNNIANLWEKYVHFFLGGIKVIDLFKKNCKFNIGDCVILFLKFEKIDKVKNIEWYKSVDKIYMQKL